MKLVHTLFVGATLIMAQAASATSSDTVDQELLGEANALLSICVKADPKDASRYVGDWRYLTGSGNLEGYKGGAAFKTGFEQTNAAMAKLNFPSTTVVALCTFYSSSLQEPEHGRGEDNSVSTGDDRPTTSHRE